MWKTNSRGANTFAKQCIDISTSFSMFFYYCIIYCMFMSMFFMSIPVIWINRHLLFPISILRIVGHAFVLHILSTVKIIVKKMTNYPECFHQRIHNYWLHISIFNIARFTYIYLYCRCPFVPSRFDTDLPSAAVLYGSAAPKLNRSETFHPMLQTAPKHRMPIRAESERATRQ